MSLSEEGEIKFHQFTRPEALTDSRKVGEVYSPDHDHYDEGARYVYRQGAHHLTFFWKQPTVAEVEGFRTQPVEVAVYTHGLSAFLLCKIHQVCEWSDVAFNIHLLPEAEREIPQEPAGERARLLLTLVDAENGIIRAKRIVSLDKVMTQALRHVMEEQSRQTFIRALYDAAVQEAHGRFADSDAMVRAAEFQEATLG